MRKPLILATLLLLTASAHADVIKRGFDVADGGTLRLDGGFGNIKVVTGGSGVAVEITRDARGRNAQKRLAEHKITFEQRGNDVVITSDFEGRNNIHWFGWDDSDYDVQFNIRVPDRYNVEVETSGGNIEIDEIAGTVDAHTSGGNIRTGRLGGKSTLKTSGGDINVDGASAELLAHTSGGSIEIGRVTGEVVARTSGGDIKIEDAAGRVDASTSGGTIHAQISRQPAGDSRLTTSGGGVVVTLAPSIAVDLDAHASGGGVSSDVPITVQGRQDDDSLVGKINGGGPKLVLRSSGGGVRVRKG